MIDYVSKTTGEVYPDKATAMAEHAKGEVILVYVNGVFRLAIL